MCYLESELRLQTKQSVKCTKTGERTVTETHQQFSLSIVHVELKQEAFTVGPVDLSHRLHLKPAAAAIEEVPFPKETFNHWCFRYFRFMNLSGLIYGTARKRTDTQEQMCPKRQLVDLPCKCNNCLSDSAVEGKHLIRKYCLKN